MSNRILIVGAGAAQATAIRHAQQLGFHVIATDANPHAPGLKLADGAAVVDVKDVVGTLAVAQEHRIAGVLCVSVEAAVRTVAQVAETLNLPGLRSEAARNATDKYRMRSRWQQQSVPSPLFAPCRSAEQARAAVDELGYPIVVKPADSAGSRGVRFVSNDKQLGDAFDSARGHAGDGVVLVEQYMRGVEISVEGFVFGGQLHVLTLSDKVRTDPPFLLDTTVAFPSEHPASVQAECREIVARAVAALELDAAPIHAEVMLTEDGPKMVELAARGPGFKVFTDMIPWCTGVDVVGELIRMAVGQTPRVHPVCRRGAVLRFLEARPGRVVSITGLEEARALPGIHDIDVYVRPGDTVKPLTSGADRVGHVIGLESSRARAMSIMEQAQRLIHITTQNATRKHAHGST